MSDWNPPLSAVQAFAEAQSLGDILSLRLIKRGNDVWHIKTTQGAYFLKAYTKDWYGTDTVATVGCVQHELAAYTRLRQAKLATPVTILGGELDRPFLLVSALPGQPLTLNLNNQALAEAGRYLAQMHRIQFPYPGYLMTPEGPTTAPDPTQWGHQIWGRAFAERAVLQLLNGPGQTLTPTLRGELEQAFASAFAQPALWESMPCFVHGDCHAHQFFLDSGVVSGVLDMEVASAGAREADLAKFVIEMWHVDPTGNWWLPFTEGYGRIPILEAVRFWLLLEGPHGLGAHQAIHWPEIVGKLLQARSWADLTRVTL